ncbi:MFS transporter [Aeromicrobium terrae]|uniref:MFS transporter n=1 Tax=Aeromicrobium terrae TaxID=2498846 RepID=A0A5C8NQ10_9ACTN|nr:MFS transporter [Aeromicrobium terrae]TXL63197.1 MFS transporter [Aeromicrobium terrae]
MAGVTDDVPAEETSAAAGEAAGGLRTSLGHVLRNRNIRRIQLAFVGSAIGDGAYAIAVAIFAYQAGGATAVGIWMAIRYTLMAVTAPFGALLADRWPRKRVMILADLIRAVLVTGSAILLYADAPAAPVYVLATLTSLLASPFLVAQRAILPSLAERPEELTAANGTASTIDSLAFFAGPALGGLLLEFTTVQGVFLVEVATFLWSMALVAGVRVPAAPEADAPEASPEEPEADEPSFLSETAAGFRTIGSDSGLLLVTIAVCVQTIVAGALMVILVAMAAEVLDSGESGVGYLNSVFGIGCILGGFYAISRASKERLAGDLAVGVLLWSLPLLLVSAWSVPAACYIAIALVGIGNPMVDVNLDTIMQRLAPDEVLGRVFGALESAAIAAMALGAVVMPGLLEWLGLEWALMVISVPVAVVTLLMLPKLLALDVRLRAPAALELIRGVDIFAPLSPAAQDSLARGAVEQQFSAGAVLMREGDAGDDFFVIESGLVEVTQEGRVLRREGPGEYFGEIALLRDVPRTATITAVDDTVVRTITRDDFLAAVSGHGEARSAAESTVSRRLAV